MNIIVIDNIPPNFRYVQEQLELDPTDPNYFTFAKIFDAFKVRINLTGWQQYVHVHVLVYCVYLNYVRVNQCLKSSVCMIYLFTVLVCFDYLNLSICCVLFTDICILCGIRAF